MSAAEDEESGTPGERGELQHRGVLIHEDHSRVNIVRTSDYLLQAPEST